MSKRTKKTSVPASSPPLSVSAPTIPAYDPSKAEKLKSKKAVEKAVDEVVEDVPKEYAIFLHKHKFNKFF